MRSPDKRGHRDAAQLQDDAVNPYDFVTMPGSHDAWVDAKARVDDFRAKGLDPNGHAPSIPHLCERSISATEPARVCNCCHTCSVACWAEKFEGTSERLRGTVRGLLRKIGLR